MEFLIFASSMENKKELKIGDRDYRAYVGPPEKYDLVGAMQFNLLTTLGLREEHTLLDIGCGSLRAGKMLIPYLKPEKYSGIEPNDWLIKEGIERELGNQIIEMKKPSFFHFDDFKLSKTGKKFNFMIAQSIFSHASKDHILTCVGEAKKVLESGGIFAATVFEGKESYTGTEWVYPGCSFYRPEDFEALVKQAGMSCQRTHWAHPNDQTWYLIYNPKDQASLKSLSKDILSRNYNTFIQRTKAKFVDHPIIGSGIAKKIYHLFTDR